MYLFFTDTNKDLAKKVVRLTGLKLGQVEFKKFSDGEIYARIKNKVRGEKVFVLGSTFSPADNILQLLILMSALKSNKAKNIVLIISYFGYARQDWLSKPGEPLTAKLMADLLRAAGVGRIITFDLHSKAVKNFFKIPVRELAALPLFAEYFKKKQLNNFKVVAPDVGALVKARRLSKFLGSGPPVVLKKIRPRHNVARVAQVKDGVKDKNLILIDDMIDTAGTITAAVAVLKKQGARDIYIAATHPVLSGPAIERLKKSSIKEVITTNTIPLPKEKHLKKIKVLSVAELISKELVNFKYNIQRRAL